MKSHNPLDHSKGSYRLTSIFNDALKKNLEVYAPLCDDMGIDYLIRHKNKYYTIQAIPSFSKNSNGMH